MRIRVRWVADLLILIANNFTIRCTRRCVFCAAASLAEMMSSPEKVPSCNAAENSFSLYGTSRKGYAREIKIAEGETLHLGPAEYAHRFEWMPFLWHCCLSSRMRDILIRNLQKLVFSSHFSGMGGLEMVVFIMCFWVNNLCGSGTVPDIRSMHTCDKAEHCRKTLAAYHPDWRPHHVARDIADRVPKKSP